MPERVRELDWSATPVGPVETWPNTLLTTVNLLLASRHPMFLWWGSELIQFYNDGYRQSLGADKHPAALGGRGVDCWAEIWPIIGPQIAAVMSAGTSTWHVNQLVPIYRNGRLEEVFWTYSYSPVRDEDGLVRGTLVVCSETTERVLSERRLRALLAVDTEALSEEKRLESNSLLSFGRSLVAKMEDAAADVPFAMLYLLLDGKIVNAGSTTYREDITDARGWPLGEVCATQEAVLVEDLQPRFGEVICPPWPESVTQAYVLPLTLAGEISRAVLVMGISPRLVFDPAYETFFQLLGARFTALLQNEIQEIEIATAAKRFSRLAEANPFGTVIGDLSGRVSYINPGLLETLGYTEEQLASGEVRWDHLTPEEYAAADARAVEQLRATGRCDVYEKEYEARDGHRVPVLIGATAIDPGAPDPEIAAFVTDLTHLKSAQQALRVANEDLEKKVIERTVALEAEIQDRKRAEANLRELTGHLLRAQDEERRHMARELHDHAGQTLVALSMNLGALLSQAERQHSGGADLIVETQKLSDDLSREIRTLSYLLHPPLLDEAGLASALRWYVDGFSKRSKIAVTLELGESEERLPRELELVIFRIVQEALTNVHRHSGSPTVTIGVARANDSVRVEISDQGSGISADSQRKLKTARIGVGVRGMEERVRQFGGTLHLDSSAQGTAVLVSIPLSAVLS